MRINSIRIGCRSEMSAGDIGTDSLLIYFRSPVVFFSGGRERNFGAGTAVVISGSYKQSFHAVNGQQLRYDSISFRMSSADKQYLSSLDITVDEPVELKDDYVFAGLIKCMKAQHLKKSRNSAEFMELTMRLLFIAVRTEARTDGRKEKNKQNHQKRTHGDSIGKKTLPGRFQETDFLGIAAFVPVIIPLKREKILLPDFQLTGKNHNGCSLIRS